MYLPIIRNTFIISLLLIMSGCTKESDKLPEKAQLYQDYLVIFRKDRIIDTLITTGYADIIDNVTGRNIIFKGNASLKMNGNNGTDIGKSGHYEFKSNLPYAEFVLIKDNGKQYNNRINYSDVGTIAFNPDLPDTFYKSKGATFTCQNLLLHNDEKASFAYDILNETGGAIWTSVPVINNTITLTPTDLARCPDHPINVNLRIERTVQVMESDENGGGQIKIISLVDTRVAIVP